MSSHRKRLRRYEIPGEARFLTFSCYRRLELFNNDRIKDRFARHIGEVQTGLGVAIYAWVIMPEHVHLLVLTPLPFTSVSPFSKRLKGCFANEVLGRWRKLGAAILPRLCDSRGKIHFWQRGGGYDQNLVDARDLEASIQYIHANPVARNLVKAPEDWRWSSASHYKNGSNEFGIAIAPLE